MCQHIALKVDEGMSADRIYRVTFTDEEKVLANRSLFYCNQCADEHEFSKASHYLPREEFNSYYKRATFEPVCFKCFYELNETRIQKANS